MSKPDHLRIFTLNCWGLKYISKDKVIRIDAIGSFLSKAQYDIVCLQELFVERDFESIRTSLSNNLPFAKRFHGGAVGGGLAVFSRFPIVAATIQQYSLNGSPLDLKGADWAAGKGAASVLIRHPLLGHVQIFNTHFFSEGGDDGPEYNRAHRLVNAWEFAKLVNQASAEKRHVIAVGDFNSAPSTLPMAVVLQHSGLVDTYASLHPPPESQAAGKNISPVEALSLYGFTYDSPLNSYSTSESPEGRAFGVPQGKRLDYILFRNPTGPSPTSSSSYTRQRPQLVPIEAQVMPTDNVPGHNFSYSDHYGVEAIFKIDQYEPKDLLLPDLSPDGLRNVTTIASTSTVHTPESSHLSAEQMSMVLDALKTHLNRHKLRARWEMRIFTACVLALIALLIGTGWSPRGALTPLFVYLGALLAWLGTTMFHVGLFYGRWEVSILVNVIEEMELYAQTLDSSTY